MKNSNERVAYFNGKIVPESEVREMYREEVKQFLEGADIYDLNYKTLTDVAPDITKQIFGATFPDKRIFIRKNAKALYNMLPENQRKRAVGLKTATGLKNILQKNFYEEKGRATMAQGTAAGLTLREKKPYNEKAFFELFGLLPGQEKTRNQKTAISALEAEIGKAITNSVVREILTFEGADNATILNIADGKSELLASKEYTIFTLDDAKTYVDGIKQIVELGVFPPGLLNASMLQGEYPTSEIKLYLRDAFKKIKSLNIRDSKYSKTKPTKTGEATATKPGKIISLIADCVEISTQRPCSAFDKASS